MFKKTKRIASLFLAFAIMLSLFTFSPIVFAEDESEEELTSTAYLMYADASWQYQYLGNPLTPPENEEDPFYQVIANDATVTGTGKYTVGLDFTTEDEDDRTPGYASGVSFMAIGIKNGEINFPGYCIKITEIRLNGEPIRLTGKGYTSSDAETDGTYVTTRMNIYNEWVNSIDTVNDLTLRSYDRDLSDVSPIIINKEDFEKKTVTTIDPETNEEVAEEVAVEIKTLEVDFIYLSGEETIDTAYIMFADADWSAQYWLDGNEYEGVKATNAEIFGDPAGQYTVSLDFSELNDADTGYAEGVAFTALGIKEGEQTMPGYFIKIDSIKINGKAIPFIKGYTSSDNGIETRMNIYNEWTGGKLPDDARSYDGKVSDAQSIIVNAKDFERVTTYEITFTLIAPDIKDTAYLAYADANWACQYWGDDINADPDEEIEPNPVVATNAIVTGEGTYTIGLDFTAYPGDEEKGYEAGHASGVAFAAVMIKTGEETFGGYKIKINSIKVNGKDIEFTKGYTSSDDKVETRMNIYNAWVTDPLDPTTDLTLRSYDCTLKNASPIIVNVEDLAEVETITVVFTLIHGVTRIEPPDDFDYDKALELDYNAYFGIQTESYVFRNAWNDSTYGKETSNFTHLTGWDSSNNEVDYGGSFIDAVISGNGTYTVSCVLGEMGLGASDTYFRLMFVSTDINSKLFKKNYLSITEAKVTIGDQSTRTVEEVYVDTTDTYAQIVLISEYIDAVGAQPFVYTVPTAGQTITITFTIEGFTKDNTDTPDTPPAEEDEEEEEKETPKKKGCKNSVSGALFITVAAYVSVMLLKKRG
ncbi:MAG TPA: hypothetical protein VIL26_05530 [Clostridia bacterium]